MSSTGGRGGGAADGVEVGLDQFWGFLEQQRETQDEFAQRLAIERPACPVLASRQRAARAGSAALSIASLRCTPGVRAVGCR
jgi:hypothetical protein